MNRREFTWFCPCGQTNSEGDVCAKCRLFRSKAIKLMQERGGSVERNREAGDWNCGCGEMNFKKRAECRKCGKKRPDGQGPNLCAVCMDRSANALLEKCNHISTCYECASKLDRCTICRTPYGQGDLRKVFIA